jgi:membrane-associated phospholipid phosphatase
LKPALRIILAIVIAVAAIALAATLDAPVAQLMRHSGVATFIDTHTALKWLLKLPGEFYFTAAVAIAVTLAHPLKWRAGGFLLLAVAVSGVNGLIKWMVGRTRPFKLGAGHIAKPFDLDPFAGSLIHQPKNLCFPSGHAALAFATAAAVAMLWPKARWRWGAYAIACVVAGERVAENAHWLSDVVAAAALGIGGVWLIRWIVTRIVNVDDPDSLSVPGDPLLQRTGERSDASPTR